MRDPIDKNLILRCIDALWTEQDLSSSEAQERLRHFETDVLMRFFEELLHTGDAVRRGRTIEAMFMIDKRRAAAAVAAHVWTEPDVSVRAYICQKLQGSIGGQYLSVLTDLLLSDTSPDVRYVAAVALGFHAYMDSVPLLERVAQSDHGETVLGHVVSFAAQEAIDRIMERSTPAAG